MEFLIVIQTPGESPGLMEVYGFYDSEGQAVNVVKVLKRDRVEFGVYRLHELEDGYISEGNLLPAMETIEAAEAAGGES